MHAVEVIRLKSLLATTMVLGVLACSTTNRPPPTPAPHAPAQATTSGSGRATTGGSDTEGKTIPGYGPWSLGMTREQVAAVAEHAPYQAVKATGGLETSEGRFEGEKRNVSFVFGPKGGLIKVQVWVYTGRDPDAAADAWAQVYEHLRETYGPVDVQDVESDEEISPEALAKATKVALEAFAKVAAVHPDEVSARSKFQMGPKTMPAGKMVWASLFADSQVGFLVFLYHTPR